MKYKWDKFDPEKETLKEYLMRHNAHPSQKDRRAATQEEMDAADVTSEHEGEGAILGRK
jgi:hypothetical protein